LSTATHFITITAIITLAALTLIACSEIANIPVQPTVIESSPASELSLIVIGS
jgi:hypothetical protein